MLERAYIMESISKKRQEELLKELIPLRDLILKQVQECIQEAADKGETLCVYEWPKEDESVSCLEPVLSVLREYGYRCNPSRRTIGICIHWSNVRK